MRIQPPRTANPGSQPDYSDVAVLQQRLMENANDLAGMAGEVAVALQVREHDSDRRKRVLALNMVALIKGGESASKAEVEARSSPIYEAAMTQLAKELIAAEETIAMRDAKKIMWESCRSLLSMSKETMRQL